MSVLPAPLLKLLDTYWYPIGLVFWVALVGWQWGNVTQISLDLYGWLTGTVPSYNSTRDRVETLWKKYRRNESLGHYECYVLVREMDRFTTRGGDLSDVTGEGWGEPAALTRQTTARSVSVS